MLQRTQTLWILLSIIVAVCSIDNPFAVANAIQEGGATIQIDAGSSLLLITLTALSVALSGFTIMSYSNLVRQKTLCWLGIMLSVAICLIFLREWRNVPNAELALTCILPPVSPISLWLAWRGIGKDQEMLKKLSKKR